MRIAVGQTPGTTISRWREMLDRLAALVADAARRSADVILLPECVWPAYVLASPAVYFEARDSGLPGPEFFLEHIRALARRHRIAVCAGYIDERPPGLLNRAALIDAEGRLRGTCDKCFLWDCDRGLFEPGQRIEPADAPWGPVGMMICADARLPEIPATLAARGARLILQPTAWVNVGTAERPWNPQPELLIPERCRELGIPIASASKWGREGDTGFVGSSIVCDGDGQVRARCETDRTQLIVADVELREPRRLRMTATQRQRLLDARPAVRPALDAGPLRVVFVPGAGEPGEPERFTSGNRAGATLVLVWPGRDAQPKTLAPQGPVVLLAGPWPKPVTVGRALIGALADRDCDGFAPTRVLALAGVHCVAVFGDHVRERTLRCRAAENRIFVVHVGAGGLRAYAPDGNAVASSGGGPADGARAFVLDLAQAADKHFAPGTDPFADRRPEFYAF